jgi:CCDC93, coiled-coil domain
MLSGLQDDANAELLQQICDMLIAAGYFRARLAIDPFDKILGGMCWCITGSNNEIELEFEDDLKLGQKVKLAEKVVQSIEIMGSPQKIFPHQI